MHRLRDADSRDCGGCQFSGERTFVAFERENESLVLGVQSVPDADIAENKRAVSITTEEWKLLTVSRAIHRPSQSACRPSGTQSHTRACRALQTSTMHRALHDSKELSNEPRMRVGDGRA